MSNTKFQKVSHILVMIQRVIGVTLVVAIPTLIVIQVILRYVFKAPLMGIEELVLFPTIWLYMIGGANTSQQRTHIECGILTLYMKREGTIRIFNFFKSLFSLCVVLWLTYWAYWYFVYSFDKWKLSDLLYIPMFFGESALFVGLFLMSIYAIIDVGKDATNMMQYFRAKKKGGSV